jgi:hypothetical protein
MWKDGGKMRDTCGIPVGYCGILTASFRSFLFYFKLIRNGKNLDKFRMISHLSAFLRYNDDLEIIKSNYDGKEKKIQFKQP